MAVEKKLYQATEQEMEEKVGLDIKLPAYNDFSEFVKYINDLEYILTKCPFLESKDEKIEFENVDVGTTWLTFFVVGVATLTAGSVFLNNMAAFVDKCMVIRSHYLSTEKQKIDLEKESMEAEKKKTILEYLDIVYKKEIDAAIEELENLTGHEVADADERSRIELAFQKMEELLDKGLQIYSTIDSPKEVKALFDPLEMKYIELGKKIELLVDKKDE